MVEIKRAVAPRWSGPGSASPQGPIDPLAALVLVNEKGPGGGADGDYILTERQFDRAKQFMSVMNGTDQLTFQNLLSGAKAPGCGPVRTSSSASAPRTRPPQAAAPSST
ncbi:hypothetical protein [Streptomyces sp. FH025]|uniref:hypothetical protein n=1 Tax=Streptomyces sp. FH025 TaxID=2815937 RepID=UPI001A9DCFEB|nr:hypothetical protein [Streptomyces sp. FH025]MBO1415907.1 hypothetical protein [Streptomyces sp. FH025]